MDDHDKSAKFVVEGKNTLKKAFFHAKAFYPATEITVTLRDGQGVTFLSQGDLMARASYKMWNINYESDPAGFLPWSAVKYLSQERDLPH